MIYAYSNNTSEAQGYKKVEKWTLWFLFTPIVLFVSVIDIIDQGRSLLGSINPELFW